MKFKFWKKDTSITVSYSKTFSLGNYESERINLSITQDLGDDFIPDLINKEFRYLKLKVHRLHEEKITGDDVR